MNNNTDIFPWNKTFETGIESIDKQHKKLVEIINKVSKHFVNEADKKFIGEVLDELTDYTIYHFKCEEGIWNNFFPLDDLTLKHLKTHKKFIDDLVEFKERYNAVYLEEDSELASQKRADMGFEMMSFLTNWLAFHILDTDCTMAETVLAIKSGLDMEDAKKLGKEKNNSAKHLMTETILRMYESITSKTLQLMREVMKRKHAEKKLQLLKKAINSSLESIFITDSKGIIIEANQSFCLNIEEGVEDVIGANIRNVKASIFTEKTADRLFNEALEEGFWSGELSSIKKDGNKELIWLSISAVTDEDGDVSHYSCVISSVSQILERKESLEFEANHDLLTSLPNLRLLKDRIVKAIERSDRSKKMLAICFIDLDGFKDVNDCFGHAAGDIVLCDTAKRLDCLVRASDTVARIGGDEFVLLLEGLNSPDDAFSLVKKTIKAVKEPIYIGVSEAIVSASIGVVIYPNNIKSYEEMLKKADAAMYEAKQSGKSQYKIWNCENDTVI